MTMEERLRRLEIVYRAPADRCDTCHTTGSLVLGVPDDADPDAPAFAPTECPECGRRIGTVLQVVGIAQEDMP